MGNDEAGRSGERVAMITIDEATGWLMAYPSLSNDGEGVRMNFQNFLNGAKCLGAFTDGSREFEYALKRLEIAHDTSTPYRPQSNGRAEQAVRRVKEGTRCMLTQSGLRPEW